MTPRSRDVCPHLHLDQSSVRSREGSHASADGTSVRIHTALQDPIAIPLEPYVSCARAIDHTCAYSYNGISHCKIARGHTGARRALAERAQRTGRSPSPSEATTWPPAPSAPRPTAATAHWLMPTHISTHSGPFGLTPDSQDTADTTWPSTGDDLVRARARRRRPRIRSHTEHERHARKSTPTQLHNREHTANKHMAITRRTANTHTQRSMEKDFSHDGSRPGNIHA